MKQWFIYIKTKWERIIGSILNLQTSHETFLLQKGGRINFNFCNKMFLMTSV